MNAPGSNSADPEQSSAALPPLPHRIVGMVESPGRVPEVITDGVMIVSGWALTDAGDATIEILVNGVSRGSYRMGIHVPMQRRSIPVFPPGQAADFSGRSASVICRTACTRLPSASPHPMGTRRS